MAVTEVLKTGLEGTSTRVPLSDLLLDANNPRFGGLGRKNPTQVEVLDHIVEVFGVEDLLSSLSINGYFEAEPLVTRETPDGLVVAEGNRRLAACLMLIGDQRAVRQADKAAEHVKRWKEHGSPSVDPAPVIKFSGESSKKGLLSYLGVRHISAAKSWDSFAKAAWVADVVAQHHLSVTEIAKMIGDQHRTIDRLLQGFYVVKQLIRKGQFNPENSVRSGRGSVAEYPFSWVYTILGYTSTRLYLELETSQGGPDPINESNLKKGAVLMTAMFGDRSRGRSSSVRDSRQLGSLASMLANPETLTMIEQGKTVDEIAVATQNIEDKLRQGVHAVRETLRDLVARLDESPVHGDIALAMVKPSEGAASLSASLVRKLKEMAMAGPDDQAVSEGTV